VPNDTRDEIVDIYRCLYKGIFSYCAYRLYRKDLAEDAAAAVFLRLVDQYPALKGKSRQDIKNWLYGTARNVAAGFLRDARHSKTIAEDLTRTTRSSSAKTRAGNVRMDWPVVPPAAIGKLNERLQDIIFLRFFEGLETSAIAEVLGMKHATVRIQLSRAIKKLGRQLGKAFDEQQQEPDEEAVGRFLKPFISEVAPPPESEERVLQRVLDRIQAKGACPSPKASAARRHWFFRIAASAAAILLVAGGVLWFRRRERTDGPRPISPKLLKRVIHANSVAYDETVQSPGQPHMKMRMLMGHSGKVE